MQNLIDMLAIENITLLTYAVLEAQVNRRSITKMILDYIFSPGTIFHDMHDIQCRPTKLLSEMCGTSFLIVTNASHKTIGTISFTFQSSRIKLDDKPLKQLIVRNFHGKTKIHHLGFSIKYLVNFKVIKLLAQYISIHYNKYKTIVTFSVQC